MRRIVCLLVGLCSSTAFAHDLFRSESTLVVRDRQIQARLTFNLLDFPGVDQNKDKAISPEEFAQAFERVYAEILAHFTLDSSGPPVRIERQRYELFDEHVLLLDLLYTFPQQVLAVRLDSQLSEVLGAGHVHLASIRLSGRLQEQILDSGTSSVFSTQTSGQWWQTMGRFIWLGVQHIATGYDHLCFLLGLLVAAAGMRSLVKVITSFTIAHSLTLALATFNIIVLPSRFTESMIAASILYVAVENIVRKQAIDRWKLTFLFGLVHGFGFSNVLREMQLPRANLALSLFSFNVGVELGQIAFVLLLYPAIEDLVKRVGWKMLRPAISVFIGIAAGYWLVQRALFG